ncbi:MAG: hypothetical protein A2Z21_04550 [Candidatus Fraserbacteria bacterium RBG_16_55_9]|uniref:Uncharacterized protein n=1 Tax=Fraserbacteria sp. (strain RBG_16_55_9) TaxID=1817864 RepID=A0A1F5UV85_FRAXR|nr:MAG: hypothetical protein A2Z21_04550 [Candidatus Fraserbacteria bacterium RBG_16_55_9]
MKLKHGLGIFTAVAVVVGGIAWSTQAQCVGSLLPAPIPKNPSDNATEVSLTPTLEISVTLPPYVVFCDHDRTQWQIATSADFAEGTIVYDTDFVYYALTALPVPSGVLKFNMSYWWRARYKDDQLYIESNSPWSSPRKFTTRTFHTPPPPPPPPTNNGLRQFDANGNCVIDDPEFFVSIDQWISDQVTDGLFFELVDLWISQSSVCSSSAAGRKLNTISLQTSAAQGIATFKASDQGISSLSVEIFDLVGRRVFSQDVAGTQLAWNRKANDGQPVANGIYLYIVTVCGIDGEVVKSNVRKLTVLR